MKNVDIILSNPVLDFYPIKLYCSCKHFLNIFLISQYGKNMFLLQVIKLSKFHTSPQVLCKKAHCFGKQSKHAILKVFTLNHLDIPLKLEKKKVFFVSSI